MKIFFLFAFLINVVTISGCSLPTLNLIPTVIQLAEVPNNVVVKKEVKKEELIFKDSTHNWNNQTVEVEVKEIPITKEEIEPTKTSIPWWLMFLVISSGLLYLINMIKQYYNKR